jgi:hypothetical protein
MADDTGVVMVGMPEALAGIHRWANDALPRDFVTGTRSFAESMRAAVAAKVPVLTGTLAGSVVLVVEPDDNAVGMGEGVLYAGWIEFGGSRGRDAVPDGRYVYPTIEARMGLFGTASEDAATASINRYQWSTPA